MFPVNISKKPPSAREDREAIRLAAETYAQTFPGEAVRSQTLFRATLYQKSQEILAALDLSQDYLGWTLVVLGSAFWRPWVQRVAPEKRLILLPHCIRDQETCPAKFTPQGLQCVCCGRCSLGTWKTEAEARGMRVMIAEGSPVVLQTIMTEKIDAVLGVACLDSLEKAFDKVMMLGIPSQAVALLTSRCFASEVDEDQVRELIGMPYVPVDEAAEAGNAPPAEAPNFAPGFSRTPVQLLRATRELFQTERFSLILGHMGIAYPPVVRPGWNPLMVQTETAALEFLRNGGKYFRPFITLAAYDALTRGTAAGTEAEMHFLESVPEAVQAVAVAIEIFHKASLVHDDIEDGDAFRYGRPALHQQYGTAAAINMGDYLIGLGYRLVAAQTPALGAEAAADVLAGFSKAHTQLSSGQGAEIALLNAGCDGFTPRDALRIYTMKTAPAFEAALVSGIRMGMSHAKNAPESVTLAEIQENLARFCRHLGVGFQILNDLDDWKETVTNKITAGGDAVKRRPTLLLALALEKASRPQRETLVVGGREAIFEVYASLGVFAQADTLVRKYREKALETAEEIPHEALRALLRYFVDAILCG